MSWVLLAVNVVLVGVTAWYAWLTRWLAKSSAAAAESTRRAAEASVQAANHAARAADAAVASVPVAFELEPSVTPAGSATKALATWAAAGGQYLKVKTKGTLTVRVKNRGATIFVHGAVLRVAHRADLLAPFQRKMFRAISDQPADLTLAFPDGKRLPARLHHDEDVAFDASTMQVAPGEVAALYVTVQYSLDGASAPLSREVAWTGVEGKDYVFLPR